MRSIRSLSTQIMKIECLSGSWLALLGLAELAGSVVQHGRASGA
jgi:hypothetical protein